MQKIALLKIISIVICVGFLSGCTSSQIKNPSELNESEEMYKASCINGVTYEQLNSNPTFYNNFKVTYIGIILQSLQGSGQMNYRLSIGDSSEEIYVSTDKQLNLVENDIVQIWGTVLDPYTYESIARWEITLPYVWAYFIEKMDKIILDVGGDDIVRWGGLSVSITSVERKDTYSYKGYSDNIYLEEADSGEDFIMIFVSASYSGSKSVYIYPSEFSLVDSVGRKYDYEYRGSFESKTLYDGQINSGYVIFKTPEEAKGLTVEYNMGSSFRPLLVYWSINV